MTDLQLAIQTVTVFLSQGFHSLIYGVPLAIFAYILAPYIINRSWTRR